MTYMIFQPPKMTEIDTGVDHDRYSTTNHILIFSFSFSVQLFRPYDKTSQIDGNIDFLRQTLPFNY